MIGIEEYNKREEGRLNKESELLEEEKGLRLKLQDLGKKLVELRDPLYYLDEVVLKKTDEGYHQVSTEYDISRGFNKKTKLESIDKILVDTIEKDYNTKMIQIRTHERDNTPFLSYIVFFKGTVDYLSFEKNKETLQKIKDNLCENGMDKKYDIKEFHMWNNKPNYVADLEIFNISGLKNYNKRTEFIEDINKYVTSENMVPNTIADIRIEDLEKKERLECKARNDRIKVLEEEMTKLKQLQKSENQW